jgi:peptidyl-prolyl cis-trans isomerase SurA
MTSWFDTSLRRGLVSVAALMLAAAPMAPAPAAAQDAQAAGGLSESVVAVVNNDIISSYDLVQRMRLLVVTAGIQVTQENLPQIQQEALRSLVDERLQIQELRRVEHEQHFEIVANDADVNEEIANIAQSNNTTAEAMLATLAAQGVGADTFRSQLRAEISWQRWIRGRYGTRLRIGEDQIAAVQARLAANAGRTQYQVSEIFIDAARAGGMDAAMAGAQQLISQLQAGAPFPAVARQFSSSPTAASGGDSGWIVQGDLPPEVEAALNQLRPGQLSQPIPVRDGVYIIFLRDRRSGSNATLVNLKQAAIPLQPDATPEAVAAATTQLETLRSHVTGCSDLESQAQAAGIVAGDLGEAEVNELAPAFRDAAAPLAVGQLSQPIRTNVGLHLIAVCSRRQSGQDAPSHEQIENRLMGQQLSMVSRRVMRDLRMTATIETR